MFDRVIKLPKSNSFFLFGARGTGKTTLLSSAFGGRTALWINLLDLDEEARLQSRPMELLERLAQLKIEGPEPAWVVIDEIQKIPALLDVVHQQIEKGRFLFVLTGSSARKLKRGAANLLAGRAFERHLFPLTHVELGSAFILENALHWGTLPKIFSLAAEDRADYLRAYSNTYLKEEIQAEQIVRKIPPFRAFLEVAAQSAGKIVNYSNIARDIDSDPVSVQSYFEILEDTLLGFQLKPFHESIRKRQRKNPKFFFFDLGVQRALSRMLTTQLVPKTSAFGNAFEQFLITEIHRLSSYRANDWAFFYLRTKDDAEVDLIIDRPGMPAAWIEIKSSDRIDESDVSSFQRLVRDARNAEAFCLSLDPVAKKIGSVQCLPWSTGLAELGLS
jgi:predicted AAA+ superfamily ATPase